MQRSTGRYDKIQHHVLRLRREGRMSYESIADATRWMRKPSSFNGIEEAIERTARFYRKNLWADAETYVEIWLEKDALAGVIYPVTGLYDVPLMVTKGFSSETFCYEAVAARYGDHRSYYVYYLGDLDRSGRDAAMALWEKLKRFAEDVGIEVIFETIAVNFAQVARLNLPTRSPKRNTPADKNWPYDFACELDAMPSDSMREIVQAAINQHLDPDQLRVLQVAEESERELLKAWSRRAAA
jgi:hypothetical protein